MSTALSLRAPFCVHIGLPKTATTMLQRRCFAQHEQIEYLGSQHPNPQQTTHHYRDPTARALLDPLMLEPSKASTDTTRATLNAVVAPAADAGRVPLWSHEGLSTASRRKRGLRADALRRVLGDCTILVTIRNPLALAESAYFQYLKRHSSTQCSRMLRRPIYLSPDRWLRRYWAAGEGPAQLDYKYTIDRYAEAFGKQSVQVLLFEQLTADASSFMHSLYGAIGVDPSLAAPVESQRENDRWTEDQITRLKRIARHPLRSLAFRYADRSDKLAALNLDGERRPLEPGPKARANFNEASRRKIEQQTREGNRQLQQEWGLPLGEFGYPV